MSDHAHATTPKMLAATPTSRLRFFYGHHVNHNYQRIIWCYPNCYSRWSRDAGNGLATIRYAIVTKGKADTRSTPAVPAQKVHKGTHPASLYVCVCVSSRCSVDFRKAQNKSNQYMIGRLYYEGRTLSSGLYNVIQLRHERVV